MSETTTSISRPELHDIFNYRIMSSPLSLNIEKPKYLIASVAEVEAALHSFRPGKWKRNWNDCADMAAKCLSRLLRRLPGRVVFLYKIEGHYLCGFVDEKRCIQVIEPAYAGSKHIWLRKWPGTYPGRMIKMVFMP